MQSTINPPQYIQQVSYGHQHANSANRIELFLWLAFLLLSPFYVFASGGVQPADLVLVLFIVVRFFRGRLTIASDIRPVALLVTAILAWMALVNLTWFLLTFEFGFVHFVAICVFNMLAVVAFSSLLPSEREQFIKITASAIILVGIGLAAYVVVTNGLRKFATSDASRQVAFFNNPNQLAYYAVLAATFIAVISRYRMLPKWTNWFVPLFYFGLLYLTLLTASRAGIGSLLLAAAFGYATRIQHLIIGAIILGVILFSGLLEESSVQRGFRKLQTRVERGNELSLRDQIFRRGFGRIEGNEKYLVLGAGEGFDSRFFRRGEKVIEMHSTIGAFIFSYGLPALVMLLMLGFRLFKFARYSAFLIIPPLIFGMTHNGLRQIEFWLTPILLILVLVTSWHLGKKPLVWVRAKHPQHEPRVGPVN